MSRRRCNVKWGIGLVVSVVTALTGQAEVFPEPYRHWVAIVGIVWTAITGYMIQRSSPTEAACRRYQQYDGR